MLKISELWQRRLQVSPFARSDYGLHAKLVPIDGQWLRQLLLS